VPRGTRLTRFILPGTPAFFF